MLDPWIIEEIRRQEEERARRHFEQPFLEIEEVPSPITEPDDQKNNRGVVIIDLG